MAEVKVAFFKNGKGWIHKAIRWWTASPYSHAELIMPDGMTWISISPFLTSRVAPRIKYKLDNPENWDFLVFKLSDRQPVKEYQLDQLYKFIAMTQGCKYDWTGMIVSQLCPFLMKRRDKWYCSEWIAHAMVNSRIVMWDDINLYDTPDLSPGKLHSLLTIVLGQLRLKSEFTTK